jgi:hypothetical protein
VAVLEPDVFAGAPDPKAETYADFVKAIEHLQNATHEQLMESGRGSLHHLQAKSERTNPIQRTGFESHPPRLARADLMNQFSRSRTHR